MYGNKSERKETSQGDIILFQAEVQQWEERIDELGYILKEKLVAFIVDTYFPLLILLLLFCEL